MEKYIEALNALFEANPDTDEGRIRIYADDDHVIVRVLNNVKCFSTYSLTDYGIMSKAIHIAEEMYEEEE